VGGDGLSTYSGEIGSICMIFVSLLPSNDMQVDAQVCHTMCQKMCKMKWHLFPTPVNHTNVMLPQMLLRFI